MDVGLCGNEVLCPIFKDPSQKTIFALRLPSMADKAHQWLAGGRRLLLVAGRCPKVSYVSLVLFCVLGFQEVKGINVQCLVQNVSAGAQNGVSRVRCSSLIDISKVYPFNILQLFQEVNRGLFLNWS